jgi:hypothetical protein
VYEWCGFAHTFNQQINLFSHITYTLCYRYVKFADMMHGKCNCGKKATSEWLIKNRGMVRTMKYCDKCKPKREQEGLVKIYGK